MINTRGLTAALHVHCRQYFALKTTVFMPDCNKPSTPRRLFESFIYPETTLLCDYISFGRGRCILVANAFYHTQMPILDGKIKKIN